MNDLIHQLLNEIGPGRMSNTAYDTAWVARLGEIDPELSNRALEWISANQNEDGSWGAAQPMYYHDRVICTLAAMIALTQRGRRTHDKAQIERGLMALERITDNATKGLMADPNGATVGFEMIAPTLVAEAEELGLVKQQADRILGKLSRLRAIKMEKLSGLLRINRHVTPAFSSEMTGRDTGNILEIDNLQEADGSVGHSPSATAYFLIQHKPQNAPALAYLQKWVDETGGAPNFAPIDIFEIGWTLWNFHLAGMQRRRQFSELFTQHLITLEKAWTNGQGIGTATECTIKDSDDSALIADVLLRFNRSADVDAILGFEEAEHFRCFKLEANPSISANIHVLGALHQAGFAKDHPVVRKIVDFLRKNQIDGSWFDKWHASPYYATSHAVIAGMNYAESMCKEAIDWIVRTQRADGSWGFYESATPEETAYCLQALSLWKHSGRKTPKGRIELGAYWLLKHQNDRYTPLWIGKALYCPTRVVDSVILSALNLANGD
jgi:halimadienyl-diphosphate synthase